MATETRSQKIIRELVEPGIHIDQTCNDWMNPLMRASAYFTPDVVRGLLEMGANVAVVNANGWTALMWAVYEGRIDNVQVLLDFFPFQDLHIQSRYEQKTAYTLAKMYHPEVIEIFDSHTERVYRMIIEMAFEYKINKPAIDA